jgi:hypothetical protein
LKSKFRTLEQTHEQKYVSLNAQSGSGFQEQGGPRSVSGKPTEETMIIESNGAEMLLAARRSGVEISNVRNTTN